MLMSDTIPISELKDLIVKYSIEPYSKSAEGYLCAIPMCELDKLIEKYEEKKNG